jgi:hypothetical protein
LSERRKRIAAVFGAALLARLLFLFAGDQPLLYTHQYTYFTNALRIAEHEQPLRYLVASDEWRTWDQHWTIAPLYFVLAATVFDVFGAHLLPLQLLQCLLDALVAACVAALGERVAGRHGAWAGLAYALYWPAIELTSWTMTENAHTPLFVAALLALVREREQPSARRRFLAGLLLGFSALARAVSSAFVGLAALWRAWPWAAAARRRQGGRVGIGRRPARDPALDRPQRVRDGREGADRGRRLREHLVGEQPGGPRDVPQAGEGRAFAADLRRQAVRGARLRDRGRAEPPRTRARQDCHRVLALPAARGGCRTCCASSARSSLGATS